ncbi:MAG: BamA/TamA family outer membrane protein [Deltaproteobacteria bacterium]|nr:BamA/TamA family outer membrane protein [Deltaproteobacteria bacterium]
MRALSVFLLLLLSVACSRNKPHKPGDEWLKKIDFEGNKAFNDKKLRTGLQMRRVQKAGRAPDLYQVELDRDRLKGQYARAGFFEADIQSRIDRTDDAATVTYSIVEGERSRTHVAITGLPDDPDLTPKMVRNKLPIPEGAPFNYEVYDLAKPLILGAVQDAGYAHAKLDAKVNGDIATHTANVTLAFTPGPKCKFGTVSVQGVDGALKDAILGRLAFAAGETYSMAAVAATQRAIYGLQRFSTVQVQPEPGENAVVNMKVAVSKAAAQQVTLGGGFGLEPTVLEVRGRAGYEIVGWPHPLETLTIDLRPAYAYLRDGSGYQPRMRAVARLEHQDLFRPYAVGSIEAGFDYLSYEAFTQLGPRAQLGYELQLWTPKLKLRAGYLIRRYTFRAANELIDDELQMRIGIDHPELDGGFTQSLIADFRDHPVNPRLGVYGELKVTEGTQFAGGNYEYQQVVPELRGYVPAGPVVFAARARFGAFFGDVPPSQRFFSGGSTSQRGFSERRLSPSVSGTLMDGREVTVPYGGAGLIDTSVESRFPIMTIRKMPLGGVVFLDGGDVTEEVGDLTLSNLAYSVGAGLRLKTIVGPIRADLGYRLNRVGTADDPAPGTKFAFHLSLGEAF